MSYRYWTTGQIKTLLANLHLTDKEIGELLGRDAYSVESYRKRNGIRKSITLSHKYCHHCGRGSKHRLKKAA